jgi:hypothetical protein
MLTGPSRPAFFFLPMLTLTRIVSPQQTLGVLRHEPSGWACCTLELPWAGNKNRRSCIPPGPGEEAITYKAKRHESPRYGETLYLPGVPGRSEILIHAGNYVSDTLGCILVGAQFRDLDGDSLTDVTSSRQTLGVLLQKIDGEEVELKIEWADTPKPAGLADAAGVDIGVLSAELEAARVPA